MYAKKRVIGVTEVEYEAEKVVIKASVNSEDNKKEF